MKRCLPLPWKKKCSRCIFLVFILVCCSADFHAAENHNILLNPGFENSLQGKGTRWRRFLVRDWDIWLNSGEDKCDAALISPGLDGKQGLRLFSRSSKDCFASARQQKIIPVRPGQQILASVYLKGTGTGYIRIYYRDAQGKSLKNYHMVGLQAGKDWNKLETKFTVPAEVHGLVYALETIRGTTDVVFDKAFLSIQAGTELRNKFLQIKLNNRLGGGIDSLKFNGTAMDFTRPNAMNSSGGLLVTMIPSKGGPLRNRTYQAEVLIPEKKIRLGTVLTAGKWEGLKILREYELAEKEAQVNFTLSLVNTSQKSMTVSHRIQNIVSPEAGIFSLPTPDWMQVARQQTDRLKGYNEIINNLLRAGWMAKYYQKTGVTLKFDFTLNHVQKTYFWNSAGISTMEWYYRDIILSPGQTWSTACRITILGGQSQFYADEYGRKQSVHTVRPVELPPPPVQEKLPAQFNDFFPFTGALGNLLEPELTGTNTPGTYSEMFSKTALRLTRIYADSYFNSIYSIRLIYGDMHRPFLTPDGTHKLGEKLRQYQMKCFLEHLLVDKKDIKEEEYIKNRWPKFQKQLSHPILQNFIRSYQDIIPLIFTGDELRADNIDSMLKMNEELRHLLPPHIIPFPYLNSSAVQFIPYVPVFLGDFYPINRPDHSGRRPWIVYNEFRDRVKQANGTRVWFMPQGFAAKNIYGLPTAGEIRLMLNLAVAAGVKGICWHGLANGTWPWMKNYWMYPYSLLGAGGQRSPSWEGVVDCARDLAGTGALLVRSIPTASPKTITLECGTYQDPHQFYKGPAVRKFALKTPHGMLLMVISQNPVGRETAVLKGLSGGVFDLMTFQPVKDKTMQLSLKPGAAYYLYLGNNPEEINLCCRERFKRERTRYSIKAELARANGLSCIDVNKISDKDPRKAIHLLFTRQRELENAILASSMGNALRQLEESRRLLEDIDFKLSTHIDLMVTPEMKKETPRYQRWCKHPIPEINAMRNRILLDFSAFFKLMDDLNPGVMTEERKTEIAGLNQRIRNNHREVEAILKKYSGKYPADNPYK